MKWGEIYATSLWPHYQGIQIPGNSVSHQPGRGHSGRVVTLSPPTSEAGVRFPAGPQVEKLVVACRCSAVYNTEPWWTVCTGFLCHSNYPSRYDLYSVESDVKTQTHQPRSVKNHGGRLQGIVDCAPCSRPQVVNRFDVPEVETVSISITLYKGFHSIILLGPLHTPTTSVCAWKLVLPDQVPRDRFSASVIRGRRLRTSQLASLIQNPWRALIKIELFHPWGMILSYWIPGSRSHFAEHQT